MAHFLFKTEPGSYSIDDLARDGKTRWTGVRNYQARNYMTNDARVGDWVLIYHSNADPPGIAGLARVSAPAAPDLTQFDAADGHYDERARRDKPMWFAVELEFVARAARFVPLDELRGNGALAGMELLRKGSRLSITLVTPDELAAVAAMAGIELPSVAGAKAAKAKKAASAVKVKAKARAEPVKVVAKARAKAAKPRK